MIDNKLSKAISAYCKRHKLNCFEPHALLCDMDGTLYDSMPRHAEAWLQMTAELGMQRKLNEFFSYEGMTGDATIDLLFREEYGRNATGEEKKLLYARKTELFRIMQEKHGINVMPGAQEIVRNARNAGLITVLVTGSGQGSLISRLDNDYPDAFPINMRITSHSVSHGKPHPEPYTKAMELAGVESQHAIALENAPLGVKSAAASGAFTIAVSTGPIPVELLSEAGADVVFESMTQCNKALRQLFHCINERNKKQ